MSKKLDDARAALAAYAEAVAPTAADWAAVVAAYDAAATEETTP